MRQSASAALTAFNAVSGVSERITNVPADVPGIERVSAWPTALVAAIEAIGHAVYPVPRGIDFTKPEEVRKYMDGLPIGAHVLVKEGQNVTRGQKIAEMGNSDTDVVKLHFEIRKFGKPVDPAKYLPLPKS